MAIIEITPKDFLALKLPPFGDIVKPDSHDDTDCLDTCEVCSRDVPEAELVPYAGYNTGERAICVACIIEHGLSDDDDNYYVTGDECYGPRHPKDGYRLIGPATVEELKEVARLFWVVEVPGDRSE